MTTGAWPDTVDHGELLGDKGYDADALIERLRDVRNRRRHSAKEQSQRQKGTRLLSKERNLIERLFGKLKQFRAIETR